MPTFTVTEGDDLVVEALDRGYNVANPRTRALKVNGRTGKLTVGAAPAGSASPGADGSPVLFGTALAQYVGNGRNGAGSLTAANAVVGDKVVAAVNLTSLTDATANFETTITVSGAIQQSSASDLSAVKHLFLFLHQ